MSMTNEGVEELLALWKTTLVERDDARAQLADERAKSSLGEVRALLDELDEARAQLAGATDALTKISAIRDSIVGAQAFNWSEHAYPLISILSAAGYEGAGYEIAKKNIGTLIEQTRAAEAQLSTARALMAQEAAAIARVHPYFIDTEVGKRQEWVKQAVAEKILKAATLPPTLKAVPVEVWAQVREAIEASDAHALHVDGCKACDESALWCREWYRLLDHAVVLRKSALAAMDGVKNG